MNLTKLKNYAPLARVAFVQAMTDRAAFYGVTATKIEPVVDKGDLAFIGGREHPRSVVPKRKALEDLVVQHGFAQTMETLAYTWFNRLVAIRYMELHGYLDHGYRVLSHPEGKPTPEILEHAEHVELPGLDKQTVIDLQLDGNKEAQLYRLLLVAQCNALHVALPFLFAKIDDKAELLLPDNLLHSESLSRKLVSEITEEDCANVEILGWLYQFYISERKDEVLARKSAVPTEDIPSVTQLFTPHWIVRYLVENSLGRLWLLNRPSSRLRDHMPYYIECEAETDFLKISKPDEIRLLDPAAGSGHMLTYAFDLLYLIYEEEGYAPAEIPALILRHNLHGLEICPRAAQLAELALIFKAREKSRRFFRPDNLVQPRILALQNIRFSESELEGCFRALDINPSTIIPQAAPSLKLFHQLEESTTPHPASFLKLLHQFEEATTLGSLIDPCLEEHEIAIARRVIETKDLGGQLLLHETQAKILRILEQAEMLCQRYHVVVANPPYMGGKGMNDRLSHWAKNNYPDSKSDLFAMFMERSMEFILNRGSMGMINLPSWLFLSSFERVRFKLIANHTISSMLHMGRGIFGIDWGSTAFVINKKPQKFTKGQFFRLHKKNFQFFAYKDIESLFLNSKNDHNYKYNFDDYTDQDGTNEIPQKSNPDGLKIYYSSSPSDFKKIPGSPIAYWLSDAVLDAFKTNPPIEDVAKIRGGMTTGDNARFLRLWQEVSRNSIGTGFAKRETAAASGCKWFPYNKGGAFRRWYGNQDFVVNWKNDGQEIISTGRASPRSREFYFQEALTYSATSSSYFAVRYSPAGFLFDAKGSLCIPEHTDWQTLLGLLNSNLSAALLKAINPTIEFQAGDISRLPFKGSLNLGEGHSDCVQELVRISHMDWDNFETSWDFRDQPLLRPGLKAATLEASWRNWETQSTASIRRMQELETENNRLFINAYGLADELKPEVPEEQITLVRADARHDMAMFLSYAVGCMMGRYGLDHPGLLLANAGDSIGEYLSKVGQPLDALAFVPDEDGIIPVLDGEWFEDDIVARTRDFLCATFGEAMQEANLRFIEESIGKDLRQYFLTDFYKDHLQTYKKRPIYWLFSSGKQRAFQCLVYLHRYNEATLSRMRTEYVIPLQSRVTARIELLKDDVSKATSTSHRKKLQKEQDDLKKQQTELLAFDEKLKHAADQKIKLDLDDGVKVNYGKFGDLLAEVKAVTGGTDE